MDTMHLKTIATTTSHNLSIFCFIAFTPRVDFQTHVTRDLDLAPYNELQC